MNAFLHGMAKLGIQEAVAKLHGKHVKQTVNTGNPLVTQRNAKSYFAQPEKKLGGS